MLPAIADALLSVIVAPACCVCDALLDTPVTGPICDACWRSIVPFTPPLCPACGDPTMGSGLNSPITKLHAENVIGELSPDPICPRCRGSRSLVVRLRAVGEYAGTLRSLVHLLKYDGRRSLAPRLARLMAAAGADVLRDADAAVPVPLHWTRKWRRGFNQASLLADGLGLAVWPALRRVRATRSQVALTAAARRTNLRGAFALARARRRGGWRARLKGKIVVLVDDVSTTGATLEACARVLREAGAREVRALTAARVAGSPR